MNTRTSTAPQNQSLSGAGFPTVNHYVPKAKITESMIYGTEVVALCGDRFTVGSCGGGDVSDKKAIVCPMCADVYHTFPVR